MTMNWYTMLGFDPPLIRECWANVECEVDDARFPRWYPLFVLKAHVARAEHAADGARPGRGGVHALGAGYGTVSKTV